MPPFSDFEIGVLNFLGCAPPMLSPNYWLYLSGFQAICMKLKFTPIAESFFYLYAAVGVKSRKHLHFQARPGVGKLIIGLLDSLKAWRDDFFFVIPRGGSIRPGGLTHMVYLVVALEGRSYRFNDLIANDGCFTGGFCYVPGRTPCSRGSSVQGSSRSGRADSGTTRQLHSSARVPFSKSGSGASADSDPNFQGRGKQPYVLLRSDLTLHPRGPHLASEGLEKRKACSGEDGSVEESLRKKGKEVQGWVFCNVGNRPPLPSWPEVGPIPRAETEDSLFSNRYDVAAAVHGKFSCVPDREALENFVYSHGHRAIQDVITQDLLMALFSQSFYCEFSNKVDEYEDGRDARNAKIVERATDILASDEERKVGLDAATAKAALLEQDLNESQMLVSEKDSALEARSIEVSNLLLAVGGLEEEIVKLNDEVDKEFMKGQDGARWGWDNFCAQLEHMNPGLEYHGSPMCIDWEVVDGGFAAIPLEGSGVGEAGGDAPPSVPDSVSPDGYEIAITGGRTLDASPRAIPAIRDLEGSSAGDEFAYLFSIPP
ncbi:putative Transposase [Senna tora]|uniref:Putative Transposase n=1 Tax=Senna tora TaxID=362788 RepID=A0A834VZG1_9FABA|nr:putative Transposase [Senna tora]